METLGFVPDTFKQLPVEGSGFEALVCQLLEAMGYRILDKPAVGTDGGRDVLVEETVITPMRELRQRVCVQCKHKAHSGKSVGDNDVGVWRNAMTRHKAQGYLLVTDVRVTGDLSRSFQEFADDDTHPNEWATFWDVDELIKHLNDHPDVRDSFFPPRAVKRTPLEELALEVRTWLEAIRYKVEAPEQIDDRSIGMVAAVQEGSFQQRVLVRCIDGEIRTGDVDRLDSKLTRQLPLGWQISHQRVSQLARERAEKDDTIRVFSLADFLTQMVWGRYFDELSELIHRDRIHELYVDLGCQRQEYDEPSGELHVDEHASLDAYMDKWLLEPGKMHISLLGEFGAGKTWFCRHYAYRQLARYLRDPVRERLPLLITLRAFTKALTAQQLINDALIEQYKLPLVGSAFEIFQDLSRKGKILLILDGFDEMARKVDDQTVLDNFWELANLVDDNSKVVLTSRTEFFRQSKEAEAILAGEKLGRKMATLKPPRFDVLYLQPLTDEQIRRMIKGRVKDETGDQAVDQILGMADLKEMARKPVLVELLLAALEETGADPLKNQALVYLYATNKLLLRNITTERTFTSTSDKLFFLCELAWHMIDTDELRIHYKDIPERIKGHFSDKIRDAHELDHWDFDLRSQTLLRSDTAGYYEFAHKSLVEYFVAFKFASQLGCLSERFTAAYEEGGGQVAPLPYKVKPVKELTKDLFGHRPIGDPALTPVREMLLDMTRETAGKELRRMHEEATASDTFRTNLVTIMTDHGVRPQVDLNELVRSTGAVIVISEQAFQALSGGAKAGIAADVWIEVHAVDAPSLAGGPNDLNYQRITGVAERHGATWDYQYWNSRGVGGESPVPVALSLDSVVTRARVLPGRISTGSYYKAMRLMDTSIIKLPRHGLGLPGAGKHQSEDSNHRATGVCIVWAGIEDRRIIS